MPLKLKGTYNVIKSISDFINETSDNYSLVAR